jgi:endogenous inhibitor of DNA gyrase (YacG/DUF329 family)
MPVRHSKPITVPTVSCPSCGKPVVWNPDAHWRPFCSERCKLLDLGEWFSEGHRIPGPPHGPAPGDDGSWSH